MAADQDRAARIRMLKEERPDLTWQAIADHVGVTMRAAQSWAEKGEIAHANAKKLAGLFGCELDYLMRGSDSTSNLMDALGSGSQLDRIERMLQEVLARLPEEDLAAVIRDALDAPAAAPAELPAPPRLASARRKAQGGRRGS